MRRGRVLPILHDLLIAYDQLCGSEDVQLPEADLARLKWRGSQKFHFQASYPLFR